MMEPLKLYLTSGKCQKETFSPKLVGNVVPTVWRATN